MTQKLDDLIAHAMELPAEIRRRLAQLLIESAGLPQDAGTHQVRDGGSLPYRVDSDALAKALGAMTSVTVVLPDDLAQQAQAAGLLAGKTMEELIRRALKEQSADKPANAEPTAHQRRLVRQNGRLVVEALPGEEPITDTEVRRLLNQMEW